MDCYNCKNKTDVLFSASCVIAPFVNRNCVYCSFYASGYLFVKRLSKMSCLSELSHGLKTRQNRPNKILFDIGCVWLASLCRPCGAHTGEPMTRANQTTACTSGQPLMTCSTSRARWADPSEPLDWLQSYSNIPEADRSRPREAKLTHTIVVRQATFFRYVKHNFVVLSFCALNAALWNWAQRLAPTKIEVHLPYCTTEHLILLSASRGCWPGSRGYGAWAVTAWWQRSSWTHWR